MLNVLGLGVEALYTGEPWQDAMNRTCAHRPTIVLRTETTMLGTD